MLSRILDDVNGEGCRQRFTRTRGAHKFKGKGVFKVNRRGKYKMEGQTSFITFFRDEN